MLPLLDNGMVEYYSKMSSCTYSKLITDPKELTLIKVIGQGSFGVVHLASWRGSLVAAKVIPVSQAELQKDVVRREIDILRLFCKAII